MTRRWPTGHPPVPFTERLAKQPERLRGQAGPEQLGFGEPCAHTWAPPPGPLDWSVPVPPAAPPRARAPLRTPSEPPLLCAQLFRDQSDSRSQGQGRRPRTGEVRLAGYDPYTVG